MIKLIYSLKHVPIVKHLQGEDDGLGHRTNHHVINCCGGGLWSEVL